jgi:hypothetical protein
MELVVVDLHSGPLTAFIRRRPRSGLEDTLPGPVKGQHCYSLEDRGEELAHCKDTHRATFSYVTQDTTCSSGHRLDRPDNTGHLR